MDKSAQGAAARYPRTLLRKLENSESYVEMYGEAIEDVHQLKGMLSSDKSEITISKPNIPPESFVGLSEVKDELMSYIEKAAVGPYPYNGTFENTDRVLLFGAIGTGKTHLTRVIASELQGNLIELKARENLFKWEFNLEAYTKAVYGICQNMGSQLSILFLGNIYTYYTNNEEERAVLRFLRDVQLEWRKNNGKDKNSPPSRLVIIASSYPLFPSDPELINIFDRKLYVPTLNFKERKELLEMLIKRKWKPGHRMSADELDAVVRKLQGTLTCSIVVLVDRAIEIQHPNRSQPGQSPSKLKLIRKAMNIKFPLTAKDFEKASKLFSNPGLDTHTWMALEAFQREFGNGPFMKIDQRENRNEETEEGDEETTRSKWTWNVASML